MPNHAETSIQTGRSIDIVDALLIAQHYVGLNPENFDESVADVNEDSVIDILDALRVVQYFVGLIPELPECGMTPDPTLVPTVDPECPYVGPSGYCCCADEGESPVIAWKGVPGGQCAYTANGAGGQNKALFVKIITVIKEQKMKKKEIIVALLLLFSIGQIFAAECGDVNSDGVVDIVDALLIAQDYVNLNPANYDPTVADVNGDGNTDIVDALLVAQYYVNLISELNCDETPTPTQTPTDPTPTPTCVEKTLELQAETDAIYSAGQVDNKHEGYTGSGFVDTDNSTGVWIEWSLDIEDATNALCVFRYACASDTRSMDLRVNGSTVAPLNFPASGAWTTWITEEYVVSLNAGTNTIRLTATTSGGAPNMDKMDITICGDFPTPTPTPTPSATPTLCPGCTPVPTPQTNLVLWYNNAASDWETQTFPIGNGRLGGMIFGGVSQERIQFNDKTLWSGSTRKRGAYQNFGDLYFDFSGHSGLQYRRELDIDEAIARIMYNYGGAEYTREYFSSFPDNVMVMHFSNNTSTTLSFRVRLDDVHSGSMSVAGNRITMTGKLDLLSYEAQVLVLNDGGTLSGGSDNITISDANEVTVILAGGTDYDPEAFSYRSGNLHDKVTSQLNNASAKSYDELKSNHIADYQALFHRVVLNLDETEPTIPTDQLLDDYKDGDYDPYLEILYF